VVPWIKGQTAHHQEIDEPYVAQQLAGFLTAIQQLPTHDDLLPGKHNFYRDVDLLERDAEVQAALVRLAPLMDISSAAQIWQKLRDTPSWQQPPVLIHGDLLPTNILFEAGRITAILDFGGLGIGDPACDLIPAWSLLSAAGRAQLRPLIHHDQDTWMRGQGWALSIGLIPLPYYRKTLPDFAALAMHMIQEVIHDYRH
jgi:aminoglycoside phosphotransferase (APT) family kinase protein